MFGYSEGAYVSLASLEKLNTKYLTNFKKAFQNKNDKEQILKLLPKDILGNKGLLRDDFDIKNSTLFKHLKENNLKEYPHI